MNKELDQNILAAALDWYQMAGVDVIVSDQPTDWFKISKLPPIIVTRTGAGAALAPPSRQSTRHSPPERAPEGAQRGAQRGAPGSSPRTILADHTRAAPKTEQAVLEAQKISADARTMEELQTALAGFDSCSLKNMAKNTCFGDGNPQSSIMLIGEAPGRDEDLAGVPFVGRAGQLLDKMLQAAQLDRQKDVWITNTVFWRPPGNRTPTPAEMDICRPFLERQIELIQPAMIIALGGSAAKSLLQTSSGIMRLRGKWVEVEIAGQSYPLLPTLHPSYLLRTPAAKKLAWHDLLMVTEKQPQNEN